MSEVHDWRWFRSTAGPAAVVRVWPAPQHVRKAAPGHVATVRQLIVDGLGDDGRKELGRTVDRAVASLSRTDLPVTLPTPPEPGTGNAEN